MSMNSDSVFSGYLAATFTPLNDRGDIAPGTVPAYASHLRRQGVGGIFVNGTTGECHSLSVSERKELLEAWMSEWKPEHGLRIAHVGHLSLPDALDLTRHAASLGVDFISAMPPFYFKPATLEDGIDYCATVASEAPDIPFLYYHIPGMTGIHLPMGRFLEAASQRIPNFAGVKYSEPDFIGIQRCRSLAGKELKIYFGCDECLLPALSLGVQGAIGSTYNFLGPVFQRLLEAARQGRMEAAREEQMKVVDMVDVLASFGYLPAAKQVMQWIGCDCGPVRAPLKPLTPDRQASLKEKLEKKPALHE